MCCALAKSQALFVYALWLLSKISAVGPAASCGLQAPQFQICTEVRHQQAPSKGQVVWGAQAGHARARWLRRLEVRILLPLLQGPQLDCCLSRPADACWCRLASVIKCLQEGGVRCCWLSCRLLTVHTLT